MTHLETDLVELRKLAGGATPGPWMPHIAFPKSENYSTLFVTTDSEATRTDLRFIAAANPATILSLIDRLERAEGALQAISDDDVPRIVHGFKKGQCLHELYMYENCFNCVASFAEAALKGDRE